MKKRFLSPSLGAALVALMFSAQTFGAVFDLDFNTDPADLGILFTGSSEWLPDEGVDNSGFLSVTFAMNDQRGAILFPDLEEGQPLTAFDISADLRVGGGTAQPADGFSFNFARPEDPAIEDIANGGPGLYAAAPDGEANLPEEGTTTGLAIGFDEWLSGGAAGGDVIGMSIRIDDELVEQIPFPTLNGEVDDQTSLQTGPQGVDYNELGWATLELSLSSTNNLRIAYKGLEVFNEQIDYEPSPGLLVFAGRTGGANSNHHIDNISIRTNADASGGGGGLTGDFDQSGALDAPDIDDLTGQSAGGTNNAVYDLNSDTFVNEADVNVWISDLFNSWVGDANLDGEFNSGDLVAVLATGTYEADVDSVWSSGDFNGDGRTNSTDLVAALAGGGYEAGPKAAVAAVPEPASLVAIGFALLGLVARRLRR
jgi:hypothetical protein